MHIYEKKILSLQKILHRRATPLKQKRKNITLQRKHNTSEGNSNLQ